ncbi:hypothetical protein BDQ12DRAFT_678787 [Crucibulum laeve]|uniref:NUDE domain-containing protein n=1 Tax=Crucibulum laeve TaxID=68775 RepID=A0A5C3M6R2_9AGAR|nr:hypothetical protein BDQ12DRAFT_678787 [Crucibulum laeve]
MTAVLSATDALRNDRHMSLDDNHFDYSTSAAEWRAKYNEVLDMLAETRTELDDFHHASKELEAELESELQRTEKAHQDLKVKVARAETERDEWKTKFMTLQTTHNTTTTSLQRELDRLRQDHQQTKIQLRELEMGNDDLERNERAVSSSLADMESKYSRALEEKILLEHELLEKASLEEESQRLKDELRDANVEISILKDQLGAAEADKASSQAHSSQFHAMSVPSDDNLLNTMPPPDLQLSELSPASETPAVTTTPKASTSSSGHSVLISKAGIQADKLKLITGFGSPSGIGRSSGLPLLYSPSIPSPRTPIPRPVTMRNPSSMSTASSTSTTAKNKGVQMVSEMRARVRNLEQKIHTRVPRLRMGSITGRQNTQSPAMSTRINAFGASSSSSSTSNSSTAKTSLDSLSNRRSIDSRRSHDSDISKASKRDTKGDSSGWVLIMEDSPSPVKDKEKERKDRRRLSSPTAPTAFRPASSSAVRAVSPVLSSGKSNSLAQSTMHTGLRRPQSRLSGGLTAVSTSRPATPTFLPVPSSGAYGSNTGLKRSTGPGGPNPYSQPKRSSLGASTVGKPRLDGPRERPTAMPPHSRPGSNTPSSSASVQNYEDDTKALPQLPGLHANITMRGPSKTSPTGDSRSLLAKSRIGRPSGGGRKSAGDSNDTFDIPKDARTRAGSNATGK